MRALLWLIVLGLGSPAGGAVYYVAPTGGADSNPGTLGAPFATFGKAISTAAAGDTIYARGGTYNLSSRLRITKSGSSTAPLNLLAYPGEVPVLDFSSNTSTTDRGVQLDAHYWNITGLTIQRAPDNGLLITGSNNTIDRVVSRWNKDSGVQISAGSIGAPSNNRIINTDSYENYDPVNHGENADGFAIKFRGLGQGNVVYGARAWGNSDDGFDFWAAESGVTVVNSWSFKNGYNIWSDNAYAGDSNGFKLGHDSGTHLLANNLVWGHRGNGIDVNGNATAIEEPTIPITHGVKIYNNSVFDNDGRNFLFDESFAHELRNNVSLLGGSADLILSGNVHSNNSWNGAAFSTDANDFLSLLDAGAMGPRQADGSLPYLSFLRLKAGSNLIDAGYDTGWPYIGVRPELGAYEYFPAVPEPVGGLLIAGCAAVLVGRRPRSEVVPRERK